MTEQTPPQQPATHGYSLPAHWHQIPQQDDDEINLLDLLLMLARRKRLILGLSIAVTFIVAGITLLIPNTYHAEVLVAPAQSDKTSSSALGSLSSLASLAGVSIGGTSGSNVSEALAVLQSREFLWQFVQENNLLPILFAKQWDAEKGKWEDDDPANQPGPFDVSRLMIDDKVLSVNQDSGTGLIKISIEWTDAKMATEWANALVARVNKYMADNAITRSKGNLQYLNEQLMQTRIEDFRNTLYDLIASEQKNAMIANTQKQYAFRVIDPAMVPDEKIKPKRAMIVIIANFAGFFLSLILAFVLETIENAKSQPEQEARMRELRKALRWRRHHTTP